jgi:hypothetical protein
MHVVPGIAYSMGGYYFLKECESQHNALMEGWTYWNHLTEKEREECDVFYAGIFCCNDEGVADLGSGAWIIADWLDDPDEVTFHAFRRVSAC